MYAHGLSENRIIIMFSFFKSSAVCMSCVAQLYVLVGDVIETSIDALHGDLIADAVSLLSGISFPNIDIRQVAIWVEGMISALV
jgi:hypothetical protein